MVRAEAYYNYVRITTCIHAGSDFQEDWHDGIAWLEDENEASNGWSKEDAGKYIVILGVCLT